MMVDKEVIDTMLRLLAYITGQVDRAARDFRVDDDSANALEYNYLTGQRDCTKHIIDLLTE